jgi:hypothetical protein
MIDELVICVWDGPSRRDIVLQRPSWADVDAAIRALDNADRNDIYLCPTKDDPETYLSVVGGAGRYVVTGAIRNEEFPVVLGGRGPEGAQEHLVVGGQRVLWPTEQVVDLETALRAAKAFYETTAFDGGGVTWGRA